MSIQIEITGNLTAAPEFRFTNSGRAVASARLASNKRYRDKQTGEWKNGKTTFLRVTAWADLAQYLAENFHTGDWVTVSGHSIAADPWINRDGEAAASLEVTAYRIEHRQTARDTSDEQPNTETDDDGRGYEQHATE